MPRRGNRLVANYKEEYFSRRRCETKAVVKGQYIYHLIVMPPQDLRA